MKRKALPVVLSCVRLPGGSTLGATVAEWAAGIALAQGWSCVEATINVDYNNQQRTWAAWRAA